MVVLVFSIGLSPHAQASVTNPRTGGVYDTVSAAAAETLAGDTLEVDAGHYDEPGIRIDKHLTIVGLGAGVVLENDVSDGIDEIFDVVGGAHLTLNSLTLTGSDRALRLSSASATLDEVVFAWNYALDYGAATRRQSSVGAPSSPRTPRSSAQM